MSGPVLQWFYHGEEMLNAIQMQSEVGLFIIAMQFQVNSPLFI